MKKTLLFLFALIPFLISAQDISTHIPKRSTYVVSINPGAHLSTGDVSQVNQLEMFTRTNEYGRSGFDYLYGDEDLEAERQEAFKKLFTEVFTHPKALGVDSTRKVFIYNDTPDSIHYWAYLIPLSNSSSFGEYVSTKLFEEKQTPNKGSGFSVINAERISIGWTSNYAIIVLADFDYTYSSNSFEEYALQVAIADSTAMADAMEEEFALKNDTVISDSIRASRSAKLMKEADEMRETLANDTTPEEEVIVDYYSGYYNNRYGSQSWLDSEKEKQKMRDTVILKIAADQLKRLINLNYDQSVESVPQFRTVIAENSDAVYWYNYGELMQQTYLQNMSLRMSYSIYTGEKVDTSMIANMWEGSYVASVITFTGNTATMDQRMYFSPALQEHTRGLYTGRVDRKMFKYVRGENMMGFVAMSVDMEKFMKFYGSIYREMLNNSFAGMYGNYYLAMWDMVHVFLDESTLYNMLDGDLVLAMTDLKPFTSSYITYEYDENFNKTEIRKEKTEVRPEFIMLAGLGKEKKAMEIIAALERINAVKKQNNLYYLINTPGEFDVKIFLAIHNGMLIITNNEELMQQKLKHGYSKHEQMSGKLRKLGRKSPVVGYWDGKKTFELVKKNQSEVLTEKDKESLDVLQREVNSGVILGKRSKNGVQRIEMKLELNPAEEGKKQTSFVRFFRLMNSLFLIRTNS